MKAGACFTEPAAPTTRGLPDRQPDGIRHEHCPDLLPAHPPTTAGRDRDHRHGGRSRRTRPPADGGRDLRRPGPGREHRRHLRRPRRLPRRRLHLRSGQPRPEAARRRDRGRQADPGRHGQRLPPRPGRPAPLRRPRPRLLDLRAGQLPHPQGLFRRAQRGPRRRQDAVLHRQARRRSLRRVRGPHHDPRARHRARLGHGLQQASLAGHGHRPRRRQGTAGGRERLAAGQGSRARRRRTAPRHQRHPSGLAGASPDLPARPQHGSGQEQLAGLPEHHRQRQPGRAPRRVAPGQRQDAGQRLGLRRRQRLRRRQGRGRRRRPPGRDDHRQPQTQRCPTGLRLDRQPRFPGAAPADRGFAPRLRVGRQHRLRAQPRARLLPRHPAAAPHGEGGSRHRHPRRSAGHGLGHRPGHLLGDQREGHRGRPPAPDRRREPAGPGAERPQLQRLVAERLGPSPGLRRRGQRPLRRRRLHPGLPQHRPRARPDRLVRLADAASRQHEPAADRTGVGPGQHRPDLRPGHRRRPARRRLPGQRGRTPASAGATLASAPVTASRRRWPPTRASTPSASPQRTRAGAATRTWDAGRSRRPTRCHRPPR